MKRLLALLLLALPAYAYATVWQLNAVDDYGVPITGQFVENNGVIESWDFIVDEDYYDKWHFSVASCAWFVDIGSNCVPFAVTSRRDVSFEYQRTNPSAHKYLDLSLVADLGSANTIELVPGNRHQDNVFTPPVFSGSHFLEDNASQYSDGTRLLVGTITAVPEPSTIVFFVAVALMAVIRHQVNRYR